MRSLGLVGQARISPVVFMQQFTPRLSLLRILFTSLPLYRFLYRKKMDQSPAARALQVALKLVLHQWELLFAATDGNTEIVRSYLDMGIPITTKDVEGFSLLHRAAWGGHVTTMRLLIRRGCDVDSIHVSGRTPLQLAARNGQTRAVRELIRHGASKSVVSDDFGTPLQLAALGGHVETVVAMLEEGCPIDAVDNDGLTVLFSAAKGGHVEVIKALVGRGCDVNAANAKGWIPLHCAAACGKTEAVCEFIRLGASKSVTAGIFGTPLHQAAINGQLDTTVAMLEEGCPIVAVTSDEASILHFAAFGGVAELVRELVDRGCDVNAVDGNGCTPLHIAAGRGRVKAVHELIKLHATKSVIAGIYGTPLHEAACNGHIGTVVALLEEGCTIGEVNSSGCTVLHFAAEKGHVEMVRELVARGSDVNAVDMYGSSPLHFAAFSGRTEAARELIKHGTTSSMNCDTNESRFHVALQNGHEEAKAALLEQTTATLDTSDVFTDSLSLESDFVNRTNCNGLTPLMWGFGGGHIEVCHLLVASGAIISAKDKFSWLAFEHCFVGGHSSKLIQLCEECGIRNSGEGLRDALSTLITLGLVDAHKVLCLCAISGDSVFLEDQFIDLLKTNCCTLPMIVKCAKAHFTNRVTLLDELHLPVDSALNPLHISLLSLKLFEIGLVPYRSDAQDSTNHALFISRLLSHSVLRETVHENLPNGLSPLDLARQFELHEVAAQIEKAGGRPGVWANLPQSVFMSHRSKLFQFYSLLKNLCDVNHGGHEAVKEAVIALLGGQTMDTAAHVANARQMVKEQVLGQRPDLADIVMHVLPHIQVRHWKRVGLALHLEKNTIDDFQQKSQDNDDRYLETLSYWLEHGSSVTWKTLLDVLGHFETKHTIDELTDKIVSELESTHQVSVQRRALTEMLCSDAVLPSCLLIVFELSPPPPLRR